MLLAVEVQVDEKLGLRRPRVLRGVAGGLGCAKDLPRSRCGCSGGPTSRNGGFSPLKSADDTAPISVADYMGHAIIRLLGCVCFSLGYSSAPE